MRNIRLLIEYDGTGYNGWQVQPEAPTIQGAIVRALKELTHEEVKLKGASRIDSGAHALGQVANFFTCSDMPSEAVLKGLNYLLPADVLIKEAIEVDEDFDAMFNARAKTYLYRVLNRTHPSPVLRNYCWHVPQALDTGLMREGAALFVGEKDFSTFRAAGSGAPHSVREIFSLIVERSGEFVEFSVRGSGFLRHMVRIIVSTLVRLGAGRLEPCEIVRIIEAKDRTLVSETAPPGGLYLIEVEY